MLAVLIALLAVEPSPSPKPRPTPAPVLEGRVQGPDGKAIKGALVVARSRSAAWTDPPLATKTDTAGAFRLTVKSRGSHEVWAQAHGLAVSKREDVRPGTPLLFRLESGAAIEGVVRDGSGAPVEGARVETEPNDRIPAWTPGAGTATATTDRNGRFRLTGLDRRPQTVCASARGYGRARRQGVPVGRGLELILVPGAGVSGIVVDAEGRPLGDVVVRLDARQRFQRSPMLRTSDAQGRFSFDGITAGSYALVARHRELGLALSPGLEIGGEGDVRRDIILMPGVAVVGRLVDPEGLPVSGRVAVGEIAGEPAPSGITDALGAEAGADGRFRIDGVPLGPAALTVNAPGFATRRADFEARSAPAGTDLGDLTMDPALRLRGRVRARTGAPVSEATISVFQSAVTNPLLRGTSDKAGNFLIGGVQPGRWSMSVTARGFTTLSTDADAGASDLDLVLDPAGSIAGMVVDEKGAAVSSFRVHAQGDGTGSDAADEFSPADGHFLLESVREGVWAVVVSAPGYGQTVVPEVAVRPGRASDVGRVRLGRGATIRGQVVTPDDAPVPGATISAFPRRQMGDWGDRPTATSDVSGRFELTGVPTGPTSVGATHPSYADNHLRIVDADPARPADVRIELRQGGRIEGTARRRDGGSLMGAIVFASPHDEAGEPFMQRRSSIEQDGSFAIDRIPAGSAFVSLMVPGGGLRFSGAASRHVEVREGATTTVDLVMASILVSGRVTRADGPVSGARVDIRSMSTSPHSFSDSLGAPPGAAIDGPERGTALTDDDGFYRLLVNQPGAASVSVEVSGIAAQHQFPDVEIPDSETFTLDLPLGAAAVSGTVVDSETNAPLPDAWVSAMPRDGLGAQDSSACGPDGRFRVEVTPGDYRLTAGATGYVFAAIDVSLSPSGLSDLVITLDKGFEIRGRLVDAGGNGVSEAHVRASAADSRGGAQTLLDGSFRIAGLLASSHTLYADAGDKGFALRSDVAAPAEGVVLQLSPGGRVRVRALAVDGRPAEQASVRVAAIDGRIVDAIEVLTHGEGLAELTAPAGVITLEASATTDGGGHGSVVVFVPEGQTVAAEIALTPPGNEAR